MHPVIPASTSQTPIIYCPSTSPKQTGIVQLLLPVLIQLTNGFPFELRLLLQHLTFKHAFENRVLIAPVDKESSSLVLDSGAGTGNSIDLLMLASY